MAKKRTLDEILYPIPSNLSLSRPLKDDNAILTRDMVKQALKASYEIKEHSSWDFEYRPPQALVTDEQIDLVVSLMQAFNPTNALENALAIQFIATYIKGLKCLNGGYNKEGIAMFDFGHKVLEALNKYRNRGAQQINVQYNVNQGQVMIQNIKEK